MRNSYPPHEPERAVIPYGTDPLDRVLYLGGRATTTIVVALFLALGLHGVAAARAALVSLELVRWSRDMQARISDRLVSSYDIEAVKPPEPPPAPEPPPPEKEEPKAPPPQAAANEPPPPPPAAAQAGKIIAAEPDPNDPVDLTGGFVNGNGASFTGGVTQAGGTSLTPVTNSNARANGVPGGTGGPQAAPVATAVGPDRSRAAGLSGSSDWKCDWPAEADSEQIDDAFVMVEVMVGPNGRAQKVNVLKDPGHGFGRNARSCAMRESFTAPLDREGNPIAGMTKPFRIHFER